MSAAANLQKLVTVLITVPSKEVGLNISRVVVTEKLAACVNILPSVTSVYEWEGKIEESEELLMIVKTTHQNISKLETKVLSLHPYDTPEFIVLPIEHSSASYASWVRAQTRSVKVSTGDL